MNRNMEKLKKLGYVLRKQEQQSINGGQSKSTCADYARCLTLSDCINNDPNCSYTCDFGSFGKPQSAGVCIPV